MVPVNRITRTWKDDPVRKRKAAYSIKAAVYRHFMTGKQQKQGKTIVEGGS